jgi:hypothetical protein
MVVVQVCQWSAHAVVEAAQDEGPGREGSIETPGAGTGVGCGGRDSNQKVRLLRSNA